MSLAEALARVEARFEELTNALSDPAVLGDPSKLKKVAKERASLEALIGASRELKDVKKQIGDNRTLAFGEDLEQLIVGFLADFLGGDIKPLFTEYLGHLLVAFPVRPMTTDTGFLE